jgi:hypothetical protein
MLPAAAIKQADDVADPRQAVTRRVRGKGGVPSALARRLPGENALVSLEPMTGIEPAYSAWEADVLPLNYIGILAKEG